MMYGALGRKTSHTANHPIWAITFDCPFADLAKNHAAMAGTAARNRFQTRNPNASEPDHAKRNRRRAAHQPSSVPNSKRRRGALAVTGLEVMRSVMSRMLTLWREYRLRPDLPIRWTIVLEELPPHVNAG